MRNSSDKTRYALYVLLKELGIKDVQDIKKIDNPILKWTKLKRETGVAINTLKRYVAIILGKIGDADHPRLTLDKLKNFTNKEITDFVITGTWKHSNQTEPDWKQVIHDKEQRKLRTSVIYEDYLEDFGEAAYAESTFYKKLACYKKSLTDKMYKEHFPGEAIEVDFAGTTLEYSKLPLAKGKVAQLFAAVLPCSGYSFFHACADQTTLSWLLVHKAMFEYFGGVPNTVIPDNLKAAVIKAGYEPELNISYNAMGMDYGFRIHPAKKGTPKGKAYGENGVGHLTEWITKRLKGQHFESIEEINAAIKPLLEEYNSKPYNKGASRNARFEDEKSMLSPLPENLPDIGVWQVERELRGYYLLVNGVNYSVPHKHKNQKARAKLNDTHIMIYVDGKQVAKHAIAEPGQDRITLASHMPPNHQAAKGYSREFALSCAEEVCESLTKIIDGLFTKYGEHNNKAMQTAYRILKLGEQFGEQALCQASDYRYGLVGQRVTFSSLRDCLRRKSYLEHNIPVQTQLPLGFVGGIQ